MTQSPDSQCQTKHVDKRASVRAPTRWKKCCNLKKTNMLLSHRCAFVLSTQKQVAKLSSKCQLNHWNDLLCIFPQTVDQSPQESWLWRWLPYQTSSACHQLHFGIPKSWLHGDHMSPRWQQSRPHVKNKDSSFWSQRKPWESRNHVQQLHNCVHRRWRILHISKPETG